MIRIRDLAQNCKQLQKNMIKLTTESAKNSKINEKSCFYLELQIRIAEVDKKKEYSTNPQGNANLRSSEANPRRLSHGQHHLIYDFLDPVRADLVGWNLLSRFVKNRVAGFDYVRHRNLLLIAHPKEPTGADSRTGAVVSSRYSSNGSEYASLHNTPS